MNKLESKIYNVLDNYPDIKKLVRDVYQWLCSFIPVKNKMPLSMIARPGYFFGFHDKCPWSPDDSKLLTHKLIDISSLQIEKYKKVGIGYFSGEHFTDYTHITTTNAWNFQQGSMLQWVGCSNLIAFNDYAGEKTCSYMIDTDGNVMHKFERPFVVFSHDGNWALSYSFERLRIGMPGYEYACGLDLEEQAPIPKKDGLYLINTNSGNISRLFSIEDIVNYNYCSYFKDSYHFFSHCIFAPSNERFVFFHRWLQPNNYLSTRMISCDLNGSNLFIFPTNGMVSHICWLDDESIIAYANTVKHGRNYYRFTDRTGKFSIIGKDIFTCDGHPQVSFDKIWLITDTYADRFRRQFLNLYDFAGNILYNIAMLRIPAEFKNEVRCDFHPRWNRHSTMISFDSAHTGVRSHCTIELPVNSHEI